MADVYKWYPVDFSGEGSWIDFAFEKTKADAMLRVGIIKRELDLQFGSLNLGRLLNLMLYG